MKDNICPSVSYTFKSLAKSYGSDTVAIICTGMGNDGAYELKVLKEIGALTIAQDKESSLVFGMPGEAVKLNAANYQLNPDELSFVFSQLEKVTM